MFPGNKRKALTFSFDDGVTQDRRLVALFNKYGFKCTWNINSALLGVASKISNGQTTVNYSKISPNELKALYEGHEVAVHTLYHPDLCKESEEIIIKNIEEDRVALEKLVGYSIIGMAYPCGTFDDRVVNIINNKTAIKYSRTIMHSFSFDRQNDLLRFMPTVYCLDLERLSKLIDEFIELKPEEDKILYIWGHAYDLDFDDSWEKFEELIKKLAHRDDIFYGTNKEVLIDSLK